MFNIGQRIQHTSCSQNLQNKGFVVKNWPELEASTIRWFGGKKTQMVAWKVLKAIEKKRSI